MSRKAVLAGMFSVVAAAALVAGCGSESGSPTLPGNSASPTSEAAAAPADPSTLAVGGFSIRVKSYDFQPSIWVRPKSDEGAVRPEGIFLVVGLEITNTQTVASVMGAGAFSLKDSQGRSYDESTEGMAALFAQAALDEGARSARNPYLGEFPPGIPTPCRVVFDVPRPPEFRGVSVPDSAVLEGGYSLRCSLGLFASGQLDLAAIERSRQEEQAAFESKVKGFRDAFIAAGEPKADVQTFPVVIRERLLATPIDGPSDGRKVVLGTGVLFRAELTVTDAGLRLSPGWASRVAEAPRNSLEASQQAFKRSQENYSTDTTYRDNPERGYQVAVQFLWKLQPIEERLKLIRAALEPGGVREPPNSFRSLDTSSLSRDYISKTLGLPNASIAIDRAGSRLGDLERLAFFSQRSGPFELELKQLGDLEKAVEEVKVAAVAARDRFRSEAAKRLASRRAKEVWLPFHDGWYPLPRRALAVEPIPVKGINLMVSAINQRIEEEAKRSRDPVLRTLEGEQATAIARLVDQDERETEELRGWPASAMVEAVGRDVTIMFRSPEDLARFQETARNAAVDWARRHESVAADFNAFWFGPESIRGGAVENDLMKRNAQSPIIVRVWNLPEHPRVEPGGIVDRDG